ncbi:hypothetical protein H0H87_003962, partial [Tephrocybe sp. NHM501043]
MRFPLLQRIAPFFSKVLKLAGMSSSTSYPVERQTSQMPVDTYMSLLQSLYPTLSAARNMRILSIGLVKCEGLTQHEYLSIKTIDTRHGSIYYVCIERGVAVDAFKPKSQGSSLYIPGSSTRNPLVHSSLAPSRSSSSASATLKGTPAMDIIYWIDNDSGLVHETDHLLSSLNIPIQSPIFLYQIVTLACVIHSRQPVYKLFSCNCYYLAGTIFAFWDGDVAKEPNIPTMFRKGSWWRHFQTFDIEDAKSLMESREAHQRAYHELLREFENKLKEKEEHAERAQREAEQKIQEMASEVERVKAEAEREREKSRQEAHEMALEIQKLREMLVAQGHESRQGP